MELTPIELLADDGNVERPENRPFRCLPEAARQDLAVLLIHGFTGTPWEMAPLARHLGAAGISSLAVRLPGHGTNADDLGRRRFEEWVAAVRQGQKLLRGEHRRVVAAGLSTGALLALATHLEHPFEGLALLSPYLRIRHSLAPFAGLLQYFVRHQLREVDRAQRHFYYDKRPIAGVHQLNRLIDSLGDQLPSVRVPAFVACAMGDQTVDPDSAITLYNRLGSPHKELLRYGRDVPHILTTDENPRQAELFERISRFLATLPA